MSRESSVLCLAALVGCGTPDAPEPACTPFRVGKYTHWSRPVQTPDGWAASSGAGYVTLEKGVVREHGQIAGLTGGSSSYRGSKQVLVFDGTHVVFFARDNPRMRFVSLDGAVVTDGPPLDIAKSTEHPETYIALATTAPVTYELAYTMPAPQGWSALATATLNAEGALIDQTTTADSGPSFPLAITGFPSEPPRVLFTRWCGGPGIGERWCLRLSPDDVRFGESTPSQYFGSVGSATNGLSLLTVASGKLFDESPLPVEGDVVDVAWNGRDFVALTRVATGMQMVIIRPELAILETRPVPDVHQASWIVADEHGALLEVDAFTSKVLWWTATSCVSAGDDGHRVRGRITTNERSPRFHTSTRSAAAAASGNHGCSRLTLSASASSGTIKSISM